LSEFSSVCSESTKWQDILNNLSSLSNSCSVWR
jgi:hypothetical protein